MVRIPATVKPPYRIPSMGEIAAVPPNGLRLVSTFSGAGGSSLGFRMAGFRVDYASEFVPAARAVYEANADPRTVVDGRDIRTVSGKSILEAIDPYDVDVLEGSPPCASYSSAGRRSKLWGEAKLYSGGISQRTDDLFPEWLRLVGELRPRVAVAENVTGVSEGASQGVFLGILRGLRALGYRAEARRLDASWLGVPQARERVIFLGVRDDLGRDPVFPEPLAYRYSLREALVDVPAAADPAEEARSFVGYALESAWRHVRAGEKSKRYYNLVRPNADLPIATISALGGNPGAASVTHPSEPRKFSIPELRRLSGFPDDFVLSGSYRERWERLGRAVPPPMMYAVARTIATRILEEG